MKEGRFKGTGMRCMNRIGVFFIIWIFGWLVFPYSVAAETTTGLEASIVIHFGSGKSIFRTVDKARLRRFFEKYETGPRSRIFVVGHTDSVGSERRNYQLSRDRAIAIRREIVRAFGLDAAVVMAMGKGEENPIGDNRSVSGRAANRRAEIYLVNTKVRKPARVYGPEDPYLSDIETLIQKAQTLIKQRRIGEAVSVLKKARGLGGDHYADWHAAYGIAGFYAHAPEAKVRGHLATAIQLDPHNDMAREYLGRITARQNVARGRITEEMGLTADNAISISFFSQQYEYLRLFNVEPLVHRKLDGRPVDAWECVNAQGAPVVYFFDHSRVYDWAFAKRSGRKRSTTPQAGAFEPFAGKDAAPVSKAIAPPEETVSNHSKSGVWESKK